MRPATGGGRRWTAGRCTRGSHPSVTSTKPSSVGSSRGASVSSGGRCAMASPMSPVSGGRCCGSSRPGAGRSRPTWTSTASTAPGPPSTPPMSPAGPRTPASTPRAWCRAGGRGPPRSAWTPRRSPRCSSGASWSNRRRLAALRPSGSTGGWPAPRVSRPGPARLASVRSSRPSATPSPPAAASTGWWIWPTGSYVPNTSWPSGPTAALPPFAAPMVW
jgi:hypothetical protein